MVTCAAEDIGKRGKTSEAARRFIEAYLFNNFETFTNTRIVEAGR